MASHKCATCNASDAKLCSSCRSAAYCSPECQKTDWSVHKTICKDFTGLPPRPSPSHKLAIRFPVNFNDPQLVYVNCKWEGVEGVDGSFQYPDTKSFLAVENTNPTYGNGPEFRPIIHNKLREFDLDHTVEIICRDTFGIDGSSKNACILHMTRGKTLYYWLGPILVLHKPGTNFDPTTYEDVTASDFRFAVDYFLS